MLTVLNSSTALRCAQNPPPSGGTEKYKTGSVGRRLANACRRSICSATASPTVRIMFAAGGTGGHVYPAVAIADEMKAIDSNVEILFVGTESGLESKAVPGAGYRIFPIPGVNIRSPFFSPLNILLPIELMGGLWECWRLLGELKPRIVVGTGGCVAGAVCAMAVLRGIRVAIQEQNVSPGFANKIVGAFASVIFVAFPGSVDFFPKNKCVISGNPIRPALRKYVSNAAARSHFFPGGQQSGQLVLVVGGSVGADSINIAVLRMCLRMLSQHENRYIIWQTGTDGFDEMESLAARGHPRLTVFPFLNSMDLAYAAADLVVARAGAMTCSELLATGKPSILIPSTNVAEDHQVKNATFMSEKAGAKVLFEDELDSTTLASAIDEILGDENLMMDMREKAMKAALPDSATKIAKSLLSLAREGVNSS